MVGEVVLLVVRSAWRFSPLASTPACPVASPLFGSGYGIVSLVVPVHHLCRTYLDSRWDGKGLGRSVDPLRFRDCRALTCADNFVATVNP